MKTSENTENEKYICKTKAYKELASRTNTEAYIKNLDMLESYLVIEYPKIMYYFKEYTNHDWVHTIKVLDYMYELLNVPQNIQSHVLMLMIYSALLHDIGMAWTPEEIKPLIPNASSKSEKELTEIIRVKHGYFSEIKIKNIPKLEGKKDIFKLSGKEGHAGNWDLTEIIAGICHSHTQSTQWLNQHFKDNPDALYVACLLRLADLLDIDCERANKSYQASYNINGISEQHYLFNQIIGDNRKIKICADVACEAKCPNNENNKLCSKCYKKIELESTFQPNMKQEMEIAVRRMISDYREDIKSEIEAIRNLLSSANCKYNIKISTEVELNENKIYPAGHPEIGTQKIFIDYSAIKYILFDERFYLNKLYGIREIIQNAYDACKAYSELPHNELDWKPQITIQYNSQNETLIIKDNGVGMSLYVIQEYFLNIGKSIYNFESNYLYDNFHQDHIGHFGLGFWAAFMLSTEIEVRTYSYHDATSRTIKLDKYSNFAALIKNGPVTSHGTEIILNFNDVCKVLNQEKKDECFKLLIDYISDTFLDDGVQINYGKDSMSLKKLQLRSINSTDNNISDYLAQIEAHVSIPEKKLPPIFYALSTKDIIQLKYDDLLDKLAKRNLGSNEIPYLNAGYFLLFAENAEIEKDFIDMAKQMHPRRNYSEPSTISESIPYRIKEFCQKYSLERPMYCNYGMLTILRNGKNVALCERNIICSSHINSMMIFDACGTPQIDDRFYLRNVRLPQLHVKLPYLNFRYNFSQLVANVKTFDVFPTLTRDTLIDEKVKELSYAIGYSIAMSKMDKDYDMAENKLIIECLYKDIENNIFIARRKK